MELRAEETAYSSVGVKIPALAYGTLWLYYVRVDIIRIRRGLLLLQKREQGIRNLHDSRQQYWEGMNQSSIADLMEG
jgi:hypothetical protein